MATTLQLCSSELVFIFFSLLPLLQNGEAQVLSHLATSGDPYPTQRGSSDFPPIVEPDQLTFVGESGGSPLPFNPALLYREGDNVANMAVVVTPEELAQALGNQAVNAIQLDAAIELAEPIFGMKPISVLRDLLLMGPGELSSSLGREKEWLSLEKGHLGLMGIRLGPGLVEVGHDEGHMPLTLVGVNLYGAGFQEGDAGNYCRCTQLSIISSVMDAAIAPHRLDKMDITPREIMEDASNGDTPTPFSESILMQSIFTRDRWTFLDFKKVVYPGMAFRMRNTTMVFPNASKSDSVKMQTPDKPKQLCQTVTVPGAWGRDYAGNLTQTATGAPCQDWSRVRLAGIDFRGVEKNYCRNPADHAGAWCFVRPGERLLPMNEQLPVFPYTWQYCAIQSCAEMNNETTAECQETEDKGASYAGPVATSRTGVNCEPWNKTFPALYGYLQGNQCRNPAGSMINVGCIATGEWKKCDVPFCPEVRGSDGDDSPLTGPEPSTMSQISMAVLVTAAVFIFFGALSLAAFRRYRRKHGYTMSYVTSLENGESDIRKDISEDSHKRMARSGSTHAMHGSETGTEGAPSEDSSALKSIDTDKLKQSHIAEDSVVLSTPVDMGQLELRKCLGVGSFAKVWQARWLGADVAVKIMVLSGRQMQLKLHLLKGVEANYLRNITHPNIVQTYHVYKVQDRGPQDADEIDALKDAGLQIPNIAELWVVQELCNKGDLKRSSHLICPQEEGSLEVLLITLREVILALSYLHIQGIVHGDLKRENILLKSSTAPHGFTSKVADFGLARNMQGLESYYATNVSGDMKYLAPETLEYHKVSPKMDVYSFGYLIWELATGEAVNDHDHVTIATHVQQVVHERKRPKFPDTVLPELAELACKCWEHDPEQRPCDQYVLRTIDSLLDRYCSDAEHLRSHLNGVSWRDMTDTLGDMLTKGTANMENGYVVPTTVPNTPASIDMSPLILAGSSRRISLSPLGCSGVSLVPAMPSLSREGSVKGNNYMMPLVEMKNLAGLPSDKA